jgi:hypothetical protein
MERTREPPRHSDVILGGTIYSWLIIGYITIDRSAILHADAIVESENRMHNAPTGRESVVMARRPNRSQGHSGTIVL